MSHGHTDPQTPGEEGAPLTPGPPAQQPSAAGTLAEGAVPDTALRAEVPESQAGLRAQARDWKPRQQAGRTSLVSGRGGGSRGHSEARHCPHPDTDRGTDPRCLCREMPAVTTLCVRLGTVGTPGPSALNQSLQVDWPVSASKGPAVGEGTRASARACWARPRTRLWAG